MNQHCKINVGPFFTKYPSTITINWLQQNLSNCYSFHRTQLRFYIFRKRDEELVPIEKLLHLIKKANVCCSYYYMSNHIFTSWKAINC